MKRLNFLSIISFLFCGMLAFGCANVTAVKTGKGFYKPTDPNSVEGLTTKPDKSFEEIGIVSVNNFDSDEIAKLHNVDIIHGDLTTSNILVHDKIYFIDFGLGFISTKVEDKAVDLHIIKKALESKHYTHAEECFKYLLEGYTKENTETATILRRLEKVEKRGHYKQK